MDNKNCHSIGTVSIVPVIRGTDPRDACQCQSICGGLLVNLCLILAAIITGIRGGLVVAVIAPVIAYLQGFTPVPVLVVPIALGNLVLVIVVALLHKRSNLLAFAAGAVLKFLLFILAL